MPKRPLVPATENSYVEVGVLLTTGYGELLATKKLSQSM
jgi:hypothetical protein